MRMESVSEVAKLMIFYSNSGNVRYLLNYDVFKYKKGEILFGYEGMYIESWLFGYWFETYTNFILTEIEMYLLKLEYISILK